MKLGTDRLNLFKTRKFLPIFVVQFCGCLNDNILKNSLIILITYKLAADFKVSAGNLVLFVNTLFILPFILFASMAGQIADKFERSVVIKVIKLSEVLIVLSIIYGFENNNFFVIFSCIFLLGTHSTFFGPIKYSVLPDYLNSKDLLRANGLVEAGTFLSILIGTIIGGYYTIFPTVVTFIAIITSIIGLVYSLLLPRSNNGSKKVIININIFQETINILKYAKAKKQIYLSILGISWFWFMGAAILSQIPSLSKDILGGDENVATLFLAVFSVGVGVGSFLCNLILKNKITVKYTALCILGLSIFGIDLAFASRISYLNYKPQELTSVILFLSKPHNLRIVIDLFCLSAVSGVYVVPLFTVMQYFSRTAYRSRIIAANNLINSGFMVCSAVILSVLFYIDLTIPSIILLMSLANIFIAIKIYKIMPDMEILPYKFIKLFFKIIFDAAYQVEVKGIENFHNAGKKVVIVANHLSFIDPALIAAYMPGKITFAINTSIAKIWWVKPFLQVVKTMPVDPVNPMAIKSLINLVKANKKVAIFPEGRISTTGSLMKIYEGPGIVAIKADANILPIRVEGTQYTHFSKLRNIFKPKLFPKITITILPSIKISEHVNVLDKNRRADAANKLYDIMSTMLFESSNHNSDLFTALIESAKIHGMNKIILQDIESNCYSFRKLLKNSFLMQLEIEKYESKNIGLILPQAPESYSAFYGILSAGKTCAMLNYSLSTEKITDTCKLTKTDLIISSLNFIKRAKIERVLEELSKGGIKIVFIENIHKEVSSITKIKAFFASLMPEFYFNYITGGLLANSVAVILFNENNLPVYLSHQNINANRYQVISKIDFAPHDIAFNSLQLYNHAGLAGSIYTLLSGIKSVLYNEPAHYKVIPELIYDSGATIFFTTYEYLSGYTSYAHPYDFYSLRYVLAIKDNLSEDLKPIWLNKYGVRIFDIFAKAEGSFIIAANTPMHNKDGTLGKLLPKIEYFIDEEERLFVRGPNITKKSSSTKSVDELRSLENHAKTGEEDWLDTGIFAQVDEDGYLIIKS